MKLDEVVKYQNDLLRITEFDDYPNALNGLQLENSGTVSKVAAAVDACEAVLQMATAEGADLLIVHHACLGWLANRDRRALSQVEAGIESDPASTASCRWMRIPNPETMSCVQRADLLTQGSLSKSITWKRSSIVMLCRRIEQAVGGNVHLAPADHHSRAESE
jgi:hypothetical protein